jgi:cysteinyl-tRNA synthetase
MKGDIKMSKSLGNTVTIQDFLRENSAQLLRMFCILSKYHNSKMRILERIWGKGP